MRRPAAATFVFIALAAVFVAFLTPKIMKVRQLEERRDQLAEELTKQRLENRRLEAELKLLKEDPVYLERIARKKFNKAKEGEIVYKVVREGEPTVE